MSSPARKEAKRLRTVVRLFTIAGLFLAVSACGEKTVELAVMRPPSPTPVPPLMSGIAPSNEGKKLDIQTARWRAAKLKPSWEISLNKSVMLYLRTKDRYEVVQRLRPNGVPAPVIFVLHYRESSNSFTAHLHEGSSLLHRTRYVPKGRLLAPKQPPYDWETSAEDAIYVSDKLAGPWDSVQWSLDKIEAYNGMGYRKMGVPSPYLWSGTSVYTAGKYVSDGRYNSQAIDQQLGAVAILKRFQEKGIDIKFAR